MTVHSPICDLFGIKYPIFLAGMGGVSYAEVCAAVSEAGGFGTLGMAGRTTNEIRDEMRKVRKLTKKPFGVDLLAAVPESLEKAADIIIQSAFTLVQTLEQPLPSSTSISSPTLQDEIGHIDLTALPTPTDATMQGA